MNQALSTPSVEGLSFDDSVAWVEDQKGDESLSIRFYKSARDGLDHVEITVPGDHTFAPDFVVDERYKQRFSQQWEAYKNELDQFAGQTRLETCAWMDPGLLRDLKRNNIHTAEHLAGLSDTVIGKSIAPGLRQLRDKAVEHLAEKEKTSGYDELKAELAALRAQVATTGKEDSKTPRRGRKAA